ncbi:integral membrane-like protein [Pseudoalteromonas fuliginea]|uniref:Integral membrane-like protein n=1 Tax=Pseudoalteromonas fuliginea TaxID=1872678 RepID=A0ABQ6RIH9_9GAMM|nr:integral membrane-like protein [Pseudoalteromonas fuliginea]KAA1167480.1 integral membrane-like protein [Pseudoalteromonas fuliginea]
MLRILFILTIFVSAFLLFQIQPMLSKELLPQFGGGASVWSASLFFYQTVLLLGYFYAHFLTRYPLKKQMVIHISLVVLASLISLNKFQVNFTLTPYWSVIANLLNQIGLVFMLLSATSVLMQRWYIERGENTVPYHWYSVSNLGSLLALISYPIIFEVFFSLQQQKDYWQIGLLIYCMLLISLAYKLLSMSTKKNKSPLPLTQKMSKKPNVLWIILSATSSIMLIATTQMISTNIPPMPLVWVMPLTIYLVTFSYTFANKSNYNRSVWVYAFILSAFAGLIMYFLGSQFNAVSQIIIYSFILFTGCMICHGELRELAPQSTLLTHFYLYIALGGALGSLFTTLLAPVLFEQITEYIVSLAVLLTLISYIQITKLKKINTLQIGASALWCGCYLVLYFSFNQYNVASQRNFYGYLTVKDINTAELAQRRLIDGTTIHGSQPLHGQNSLTNSYYHQHTGVAKSLAILKSQENLSMGVVGLGAGVLASLADKHDTVHFYELNPAVYKMANTYFDYLKNTQAKVNVTIGDGRVSLVNELKNNAPLMNALVIDAFSSDVIPAHLLTQEALELYWQRLSENGILVIHISNNHIDLLPVLQAHSTNFAKALIKFKHNSTKLTALGSEWVVLTSNQLFLDAIKVSDLSPLKSYPKTELVHWTDQKNSSLPLLKF